MLLPSSLYKSFLSSCTPTCTFLFQSLPAIVSDIRCCNLHLLGICKGHINTLVSSAGPLSGKQGERDRGDKGICKGHINTLVSSAGPLSGKQGERDRGDKGICKGHINTLVSSAGPLRGSKVREIEEIRESVRDI